MSEEEIREFLKRVLNSPGSQVNHIDQIVGEWLEDTEYWIEKITGKQDG
jgi:hypothetical protein